MKGLIRLIGPDRWKVFQVLPIEGENDAFIGNLLVSDENYNAFIENHLELHPIVESNDAMTGSYVMIDPEGRFFDNTGGKLVYSRPILDVGIEKAFEDVEFSIEKLIDREGIYPW